ncbi:MAG: hypothetical protein WCG27_00305 [Pseudomonadota bacterium]
MKCFYLLILTLLMPLTGYCWPAEKYIYLNFVLEGPGANHQEKYYNYNLNIGGHYVKLLNAPNKQVGCYLRANDRIWGVQVNWDTSVKSWLVQTGHNPYFVSINGTIVRSDIFLVQTLSDSVAVSFLFDHASLMQSISFKDKGIFSAMSATQYQKIMLQSVGSPAFPPMAKVKTLPVTDLADHQQPAVDLQEGQAACFYFDIPKIM